MFNQGKLIVRPQTAQLAKNKDFLRKQDPYIKAQLGAQHFQTSVSKKGGKTPAWTDAFTFNINNDQTLVLHMFDKDKLSKDDFIGECTIPLNEVYQKRSLSNWYNIHNKGQLMGKLLVTFEFMPEGGQFNSMNGSAMGMQQGYNASSQFNQGMNMQYSGMGMQQGMHNSGMGLQAGCLNNQQGGNLISSYHEEIHTMPSPVMVQTSPMISTMHTSYIPVKQELTIPTGGYSTTTTTSSYHEEIIRSPTIARY